MELRDFLLSFFNSGQYEPMRAKELADQFGLDGQDRLDFYEVLDRMLEEETIRMSKRGKIKAYPIEVERKPKAHPVEAKGHPIEAMGQVAGPKLESAEEKGPLVEAKPLHSMEGTISANRKGFAFFLSEDPEMEDVFIGEEDLGGALHGDRVQIALVHPADPDRERLATGRVVTVLSRNPHPIVGLYQEEDGEGWVTADGKEYVEEIPVAFEDKLGAQDGDKVLVEIKEGPGPLSGRIKEVIGHAGDIGVDISSVARAFDLPYVFSPEVLDQARQIPKQVEGRDHKGRKDLRKLLTVTIDGADAKDFDDAISLEKRGPYYQLYIHIADVSHYVPEGSPMDREAYQRGNSVYLLDRVIPMLPEEVSNGICSLNPGEDRLALTTQVSLNEEGLLVDYQFYPSIIQSKHRLVYEDVSDYLEKGIGFAEEEKLRALLDRMGFVYQALAKSRQERGGLDFDLPETHLTLDAKGLPIQVGQEERRVANRIIEEFMILNNIIVAETFYAKDLPLIYRIHEEPTPEGVERLNKALFALRYPRLDAEDISPRKISDLLEKAEGKPDQGVLHTMLLRSMTKAIYSTDPEIHFGLALDHYCHFTAPIRRYADLVNHRLLKALLAGDKEGIRARKDLAQISRHISDCEEQAQEAERDVVAMKSAEYMQQFLGQVFEGTISSLTSFGIFVMLDNTIEGLVHFRSMTDDYYTFDQDRLLVVGERSGRQFRYGQRVLVQVAAANPLLREIDFLFLNQLEEKKSSNHQASQRRKAAAGKSKSTSPARSSGKSSRHSKTRKKPRSFRGHRRRH